MDGDNHELLDRKKELLETHRDLKKEIRESTRKGYQITSRFWFPEPLAWGSNEARHPPANSLKSIFCSSLKEGVIHMNRVLRGKLIVHPISTKGLHTVIEDDLGGTALLRICLPSSGQNGIPELLETLKSKYCLNCRVEIVEPEYRTSSEEEHGFVIVRNHNTNIRLIQGKLLTSAKYWERKGDDQAVMQEAGVAAMCYRNSIRFNSDSKFGSLLLSNTATCLLSNGEYRASLLFAMGAILLHGSLYRPYYTAGRAAHELKLRHLIVNCYHHCRNLGAKEEECRYLQNLYDGIDEELLTAQEWNKEVIGALSAENVEHLLQVDRNPDSDLTELKGRGNELFKKKRYKEAITAYLTALRSLGGISDVLCKLMSCHLNQEEKTVSLAVVSTVVVLLTPSSSRAHFCKAKSLLNLGFTNEAKMCIIVAHNVLGSSDGNSPLQTIMEGVERTLKQDEEELASYRRFREENALKITEAYHHKLFNDDIAQTWQLASFNEFIESIWGRSNGREVLQDIGLKLDKRVCDIREELFLEGTVLPQGCDVKLASRLLEDAYQEARVQKKIDVLEKHGKPVYTKGDLLKRLGCGFRFVVEWWRNAPRRSISPRTYFQYMGNVHHSFTNSLRRSDVFLLGTTHMSVGFVDLSELLFARFRSRGSSKGPLRWIGYEASPYAAAKTLIITEMMRQSDASVNEIFQVWYSATWTEKTLRTFRKAVESLRNNTRLEKSKEVTILLDFWKQSYVSLPSACNEWMRRHVTSHNVEIFNFRRRLDRVAFSKYLLSGGLLGGTCGSVVMFESPREDGRRKYEISLGEWFIHCLASEKVLEECDENVSFIDSAIRIICRGIVSLRDLINSGKVKTEIRQKSVDADDTAAISGIQSLRPQSVSWSNLCDYFPHSMFHKLARACSTTGTIHRLYSMNWSTAVKGAHLMDYSRRLYDPCIRGAETLISDQYRKLKSEKYLHSPPVTHQYNVASYYLCSQVYDTWIEYFFKESGLESVDKQVLHTEIMNFDAFARSSNTVLFTYSYDPNISWDLLR